MRIIRALGWCPHQPKQRRNIGWWGHQPRIKRNEAILQTGQKNNYKNVILSLSKEFVPLVGVLINRNKN